MEPTCKLPAIPAVLAAPLRVVSLNLRYGTADDGPNRWEVRAERALAALRDADIVCLQEALDLQISEALAGLEEFGSIGVGRDDGLRAGEHAPILWDTAQFTEESSGTYWLSETPDRPGSTSWGNGIPRICTWGIFEERASGKRFSVHNVHLDHESAPSREQSVLFMLERVERNIPALITGDFNAGESDPALEPLRRAGFADTFRSVHPGASEVGTFHGFSERFQPAKIDYIWASPEWRVLEASIDRRRFGGGWPSDHAPVRATLQLIGPYP